MWGVAVWSCLIILSTASSLTPSDYEITSLPGLTSPLNFKQYAGYVPIPNSGGTSLFFWFVESQVNPTTDPVMVWFNGGPGSSSVGYGFFTEHGPFRLVKNDTVELYEYSWNKIANVLYVESPAGVGFSYSEDPAHYHCTDNQTSSDAYHFLLEWFNIFNTFKSNPFYVTGESYGGHYVPQLAERILDNQPNGINMKGFAIGNPGINSDWYFNVNEYAFQTFLWSHGLIPQDAYQASVTQCGWDQFLTNCSRDFTHPSAACKAANQEALKYVPQTWDPYDILAPTCHSDQRIVEQYTPALDALRRRHSLKTEFNPCLPTYTAPYLNRPDVLKAIHVDGHYTRKWPNHPPGWTYGSELADIALLFPKFISKAPQWRILVYSGDLDAAVPFMGTERWMYCLGQDVKQGWKHWMMNGDVAGSVIQWAPDLTFVTVKGCGHMVPWYCPEKGLKFLEQWMAM